MDTPAPHDADAMLAYPPSLECPDWAGRPSCPKSNSEVLDDILRWFRQRLPCVAGRREFSQRRYRIDMVTAGSVSATFDAFVHSARRWEQTACLYVFNEPRFYEGQGRARDAFRFLAQQMSALTDTDPDRLADGAPLTTTIPIRCPVTEIEVAFDDFECIAFCPQSMMTTDDLYDPLMYAPHPCVNMSSDVFGFSRFVREMSIARLKAPPAQVRELRVLAPFLYTCAEQWHRIAKRTIGNFASITDTTKCPVHVTADEQHWVAAHQDPAFAETEKVPHRHELPIIYASRICDAWIEHFAGRTLYSASGLARDGTLH